MSTIGNGKNTPLNQKTGTLPDVSGALMDWFQPMVFARVVKEAGFEVVETMVPVHFRGVIQPLSGRSLLMKPEGQRKWNWLQVHAEPSLTLTIDEIILYNEVQYRVMKQKDFTLYGYVYYELCEDFTGAGPTPE